MNFQASIKMKAPYLLLLLINFFLSGCIFPSMWGRPGYLIAIQGPLKDSQDLDEIKRLVHERGFRMSSKKEEKSKETYETYIIESPEYGGHINIGLRYNSIGDGGARIQFGMMIGDLWTGMKPPIKSQIDELGDFFYGFLVERTGKENVKIDRRATGPPF